MTLFCTYFLFNQPDNRADRIPLAALFHSIDIGKSVKIQFLHLLKKQLICQVILVDYDTEALRFKGLRI